MDDIKAAYDLLLMVNQNILEHGYYKCADNNEVKRIYAANNYLHELIAQDPEKYGHFAKVATLY